MIELFKEESVKSIVKYINDNNHRVNINGDLFDIYEEQIGHLLQDKMLSDLGESSYEQAKERKSPINILKRIVDKLSKIYQQEPRREVIDGNENDSVILAKMEEVLQINAKLNIHNEFWNMYNYSLLQISNDKGTPFIRTIPNHKYLIMNVSPIDPTSPDVVILFMDIVKDEDGSDVSTYWIYTDEQFAVYDSKERIRYDIMGELEQSGEIPYGQKPFVYLNKSENLVMPMVQTDTLDMTLLIPLLLSDTSYIAKFSTYTIMYGIDIDDQEMKVSPNMFWKFRSDDESDKTPSVGTIKPEGDIDKLVQLAVTQMELWLNSKGIKPGSIGNMNVDNASSGIAKIIDEADVTDLRRLQVMIYQVFEKEFWDLLLKKMYPFWVEQGLIENYGTFTPTATVTTNFAPQIPIINRNDQVDTLDKEVKAGFTTKRRAIQALNPQMNESEVDELLNEIENEREIEVIEYGTKPDGDEIEAGNSEVAE